MKTLRWILFLAFLAPACLPQGGGGGNNLLKGGDVTAPGMSGPDSGLPSGDSEPSFDTPPIAGPSENQDTKPEVPIQECQEVDGINCPEVLSLTRDKLCTRLDTSLNPLLTHSLTTATTAKPMASNGTVDLTIWRFSGEDPQNGSPSDFVSAPVTDLSPTKPDADPVRSGRQVAAAPDGTVSFSLVAGEKTGYYEIWIIGDLDTAFVNLTIEECPEFGVEGGGGSGGGSGGSGSLSIPVDSFTNPVIKN